MKKFAYIISLAAVTVAAASCQKEQPINEESSPVFYATIEDATKTTISKETEGYKVSWELYDQISINGTIYEVTGIEGQTAKFEKLNISDPNPESPYYAYYPASIYDGETAVLPDTQKYNEDGSIADILPMYATSNNFNFSFKNLCGLMKFTLKGTETVRYIRIRDDAKALSGEFTVTDNSAKLVDSAEGGVVLDCGEDGVTLDNNSGKTFYIAVPAGSYNSLHIEYNTVNYEKVCRKKSSATATVNRNKVYSFTQTPTFKPDWLCFEAMADGVKVALEKDGDIDDIALQYSTDNGENWTDYDIDSKITLTKSGNRVYFKAKNTIATFADEKGGYYFTSDGNIKVYGNIMYLLNGATAGTEVSTLAFEYLFAENSNLVSASELRLPATTLAESCYSNMFSGCPSLTAAPELPATELKTSCYTKMFKDCTNLSYVKCLATDISAKGCTTDWLNGVAKEGTFVMAAGTKWGSGESGIPSTWTIKEIE